MEQGKQTVLVTGISGYIAAETAYQLLQKGYKVRGSVRSVANQKKVAPIKALHPSAAENLELVEADLTKQDGWETAINGVDYILHIASPFALSGKKQSDLIVPAVNGTKFVLNAASRCSSVKGVVLTSSFAAAKVHKYDKLEHTYDETEWSEIETANAYYKSKTLAEREAWTIWGDLDQSSRFKFATILPGFVIGPQRINSEFQSANLICEGLTGKYPSIPNLSMATVHVADVARAHILAMEKFDVANGNRFIAIERTYHFKEIFGYLQQFRKYGYKVPTGDMKKCLFGMVSCFVPKLRPLKKVWGKRINGDNKKIREKLGMEFQDCGDGLVKMGYQCINKGLIDDKTKGEAQQKQVF